jgi:Ca2+-transporting ATPase
VARAVGLDAETVLTGRELETRSQTALRSAVDRTSVFARVDPEQKLRIVEALMAQDEIVAVTGDGVNDAPALKRAHVGVAMGVRGSDVSREAADLVLLDDDFATIVAAIEEGRNVYENIRKFLRFLFSTNLAEVLVVVLGVTGAFLLDLREPDGRLLLPLTAVQLLWINLVTDGAPAIALGLDRNQGVMQRPPRNPREPLLDPLSLRFIAVGAAITAAAGGALLWLLPALLDASVPAARTAVFLLLAAAQLLYAYPARRSDVTPARNPMLHGAVAVGLALQAALLAVPPLREAFAITVPSLGVGALVAGCVLAAWRLAELAGRGIWRPAAGAGSAPG